MNVSIFWVRAMKCMCAQTRPWFILSSEGVFGGMEFEPMLTPREKSPVPENVPRGGLNPRRCGQRAQALPTELFRPHLSIWVTYQGFRTRMVYLDYTTCLRYTIVVWNPGYGSVFCGVLIPVSCAVSWGPLMASLQGVRDGGGLGIELCLPSGAFSKS